MNVKKALTWPVIILAVFLGARCSTGWGGSVRGILKDHLRSSRISDSNAIGVAQATLTDFELRMGTDATPQAKEQIKILQEFLTLGGYYQGPINGWFGPTLDEAVKTYQRDRSLATTGTVCSTLFSMIVHEPDKTKPEGQKHAPPGGVGEEFLSMEGAASDPRIKEIAKNLVGNCPMVTAYRIYKYVSEHISYSFYYNSQQGALGALSSGSANCCDQSNLHVALLRAAGIPAKYGHGTCQFTSGTYGHVWAYAFIDGAWLPIDTTSSRNSLGTIVSNHPLGEYTTSANLDF